MILPCGHDSETIPFKPGSKWVKGQCARCWNYLNNPDARKMYESGPLGIPSTSQDVPGLGDSLKSALDRIGITQEWAAKWLGCTGCADRQMKLNALGNWVKQTASMPIEKAKGYFHSLTNTPTPPEEKTEIVKEPQSMTTWAYGVTTVESRRRTTLPTTLASLKAAGFDQPRLFVDGSQDIAGWEKEFSLETTVRSQRILPYGNWILALWEIYIRNPVCDRYAIFQDDFVTYPNLRQYLNSCTYPGDNSYWNLSTHPWNEMYLKSLKPNGETEKYVGWFESNQRGFGAVALVFSREFVWGLLASRHMTHKPASPDRSFKWIDGAVVEQCHILGGKEYVHMPALVQHIGKVSAIATETPKLTKPHGVHADSASFRGEGFNALELIPART